jgi:transcriptional regulator with XRE-family HTH domain
MRPASTMTAGDRLKYFRESAGISVIDAAVEFGIPISKLERMENNRFPVSFEVVTQAAQLYNCSLEDFSALRNRPLPPTERLRNV